MSVPTDLIARVLELEPDDRIELAHVLLTSVEPDESIPAAEWQAAWMVEIEERVREYESGEVGAIPIEQFLERLRQGCRPQGPS